MKTLVTDHQWLHHKQLLDQWRIRPHLRLAHHKPSVLQRPTQHEPLCQHQMLTRTLFQASVDYTAAVKLASINAKD